MMRRLDLREYFSASTILADHIRRMIAALGPRTKKLRLGVMGVVLPYYHPARVVEEIGMLDHLTGGRLEIGTAIGVPQELSRLNLTMTEARERNDEIVAVLDAALANRIVTHLGKYFSFSNLRLLPRPLQQPSPPRWTTVISADSARRAARRRIKISTGFNSTQSIKRIFDAYREEADAAGYQAGPECFALRRRVTVAPTSEQARVYAQAVTERLKSFVAEDDRLNTQAPDAPAPSDGFTLSADEFITGTPKEVAQTIVAQCRAVGAGHFLTVLNWSARLRKWRRRMSCSAAKLFPRCGNHEGQIDSGKSTASCRHWQPARTKLYVVREPPLGLWKHVDDLAGHRIYDHHLAFELQVGVARHLRNQRLRQRIGLQVGRKLFSNCRVKAPRRLSRLKRESDLSMLAFQSLFDFRALIVGKVQRRGCHLLRYRRWNGLNNVASVAVLGGRGRGGQKSRAG
jgi:alkanesulfonate monooxygenase SsuD/methylene tetrahydromethanopterin reductase-like flavin-dependent oxidoreductase (luciferase family)